MLCRYVAMGYTHFKLELMGKYLTPENTELLRTEILATGG